MAKNFSNDLLPVITGSASSYFYWVNKESDSASFDGVKIRIYTFHTSKKPFCVGEKFFEIFLCLRFLSLKIF